MGAGMRLLQLAEWLQRSSDLLLGHPDAGVFNRNVHPFPLVQVNGKANASGRRSKFHGVPEDVDHDLLQAKGVSPDAAARRIWQRGGKIQSFFQGTGPDQSQAALQERPQIDPSFSKLQFARFDFREIEHIPDDLKQMGAC